MAKPRASFPKHIRDLMILVKAGGASRRAIQFFNEKNNAPARQEARKKSAEFIMN